MKVGLGHLGLSPAEFWSMTLVEFFAAIDGYMERKGVDRGKGGAKAKSRPTRAEALALVESLGLEVPNGNEGPN